MGDVAREALASLLHLWPQLGGQRVRFVNTRIEDESFMQGRSLVFVNIPDFRLLSVVAEAFLKAPPGSELFSLWPIKGLKNQGRLIILETDRVPTTWSRTQPLYHFTRATN